jgi:hypothetical protein
VRRIKDPAIAMPGGTSSLAVFELAPGWSLVPGRFVFRLVLSLRRSSASSNLLANPTILAPFGRISWGGSVGALLRDIPVPASIGSIAGWQFASKRHSKIDFSAIPQALKDASRFFRRAT